MFIFYASHDKRFLIIDVLEVVSIIILYINSIILPNYIESQLY